MICTAFWKTGVWPLNCTAVIVEMIAQSMETSSSSCLPLPQPSSIHVVSSMMHQYQKESTNEMPTITATQHNMTSETGLCNWPQWHAAVRDAISELESTSASFLVSGSPLTSSCHLPEYHPITISPTLKWTHSLLEQDPTNEREQIFIMIHDELPFIP
ncbi:hypothetical protein ID866_9881 [Astraeus odoratus]|nr:hypothetical protein ID866_9881 [Astraeus odoratus]